jgi:hypothetical protein
MLFGLVNVLLYDDNRIKISLGCICVPAKQPTGDGYVTWVSELK